jgi:oligo-1,6-glucosidase
VLQHYRRLIQLRHTLPVVVHGDFTMLVPDDPQVYAFTRRWRDDELLVMVNVSGEPATVALSGSEVWTDAELLLGGPDPSLPAVESPAAEVALQPWEHRVLRRAVDG